MAGTSDKPFRMICRDQGAGLTTSEMVVIQSHLMNSNKSKHRLDFSSEKSPISVQICLLYTSPSPRDQRGSRMPSSA